MEYLLQDALYGANAGMVIIAMVVKPLIHVAIASISAQKGLTDSGIAAVEVRTKLEITLTVPDAREVH